ncbi:rhodanese domain-containing protein CG4456 isoform X2 [Anoplolepis gracilipes]|uniref:rhodanese domain-containing protein CG4456 isoform X2 n=1 Tax=Anoplolepis gracilipes TaxID=354296 RepID=UPI003BA11064
MYTRPFRRLHRVFVSSGFLGRNLLTDSSYQRSVKIVTDGPVIRNFHSSNSPYREADIALHCQNDKMALNANYEQVLEAQKDDNVLIIDVREQAEINETGKLPGSIHIPMADVRQIFVNLSDEQFEERYGRHKPGKNTKIILSCRSGKRSGAVQEVMQKLGYTRAYNYTGGWLDWENKQKKT